jgi:hypothetical protein
MLGMADIENVKDRFLDIATQEQSTRKEITTTFIRLLTDPEIDVSFKMLILLFLSVFFCGSLYTTIIIIYALCGKLPTFEYMLVIPGLVVLLIIIAVPLISKTNTFENAIRLDNGLGSISKAKPGI